ncbi:MAG TPA: AMP-binding protein [Opitutaceae bacterium]|nr:AMP-binding protein [Opitutaceae bacterium]
MERGDLAGRLGVAAAGRGGAATVVDEADPARFMASFAKAVSDGGDIFLANPAWRSAERAELARLPVTGERADRGWLMIPSGGAGGGLKFARHDGWTIAAAVDGFRRHFGMERVDSVCVLPLHHVSGFMAWMRSALTGGSFIPCAWRDVEAGRFPADVPAGCCLSLVPTQLQRLLATDGAVAWLRRFRIVFMGGGPSWGGLVEEAARLEVPLSPSYGATETAAMVAALKPEQFLSGRRGCGAALPHARIDIGPGGIVRIAGESLFRGYFPEMRSERSWTTGDVGAFDRDGSLVILGRSDDLIMTGGKKVSPEEVEAALRSTGEFIDVAVIGLPDPEWGQLVVACHPVAPREPSMERLQAALSGLASFKHPRRYVGVTPWPRNAQGKINRAELARLASGG